MGGGGGESVDVYVNQRVKWPHEFVLARTSKDRLNYLQSKLYFKDTWGGGGGVTSWLQTHLDEAGLMTAFQSASRKPHSTESALLNIHNDIILNMAKGSVKPSPF